ncbi:MAG: signal peptidase, partial [Bryobacterales bacterium]|nr:signal peptidase [Bryobacterales bacterium]
MDDQSATERGFFSGIAWLRDLALSVVFAIVLIVFLYQPVKVEGTSMMPALNDQERIFINKFTYRLGPNSVVRGDTVVFLYPLDPTKSYIKRVIGVPGDHVEITDVKVYVNKMPVDVPYVPDEYRDHLSMSDTTVPMDYYLVLGDHLSSS